MLSAGYQTMSARNSISSVAPAWRALRYITVNAAERTSRADAPVTITARICAMLRLSQRPSNISKGMSTNNDKKFIFIFTI